MTRRLVLLAAVALAVTETYRRGYSAPVIFGVRLWVAARPDWCYQPDPVA